MKPTETAEDRWEFDQQSEALYQARLEAIKPPFPAVTPDNPSQEANGVAVLPFVNQNTGD